MGNAKCNAAVPHAPLTQDEQDRITELAERGFGSTRIAREVLRDSSTVQWFLYRTGLRAPGYGNSKAHVRSNGRPVKPFTPEEDAFITDLRLRDLGPKEIARRTTEKFEHPRSKCTVANRLVMLAAREEAGA